MPRALLRQQQREYPTDPDALHLQMQALKKAGCKRIFREKVSGVSRQRPEFQRMLEQLRYGDTVIIVIGSSNLHSG